MLFRTEALKHARGRLYGEINLATPQSWHVIGYLLLGSLIIAAGFLIAGSYSKTEIVDGKIVPREGVIAVVPPRSGVISQISVRDQDMVEAGATLVSIVVQDAMDADVTHQDRVLQALDREDADLALQGEALRSASAAQIGQIELQARGLENELTILQKQVDLQEQLVASTRRDFDQLSGLHDAALVSRHTANLRQIEVLRSDRELGQLLETQSTRNSALAETQQAIKKVNADASAQLAELRSRRAALEKQIADVQAAGKYTIPAPVSGTVTAFTAQLGQHVDSGHPLAVIIPRGMTLQAELEVPSTAIGFLAPGQSVRVALDAFPYQTYGTIDASITRVAAAPIALDSKPTESVYPVIADLSQQSINAFGREVPLLSGMKLRGRIVMQRRSLIGALFEPLFALERR